MEILQTIWNALTTENIVLTNIITSFFIFIELTISMLLFTTILKINSTRKQKILYVFILSLVGILSLWFVPAPFYTFINIIICPILVYFIFKTSVLKSILSEIITYIIFLIIGSLLVALFMFILKVPSQSFSNIPIFKTLYVSTLYVLSYLLYRIINKKHLKLVILNKMHSKSNVTLLINLIIGIIAIALQSYIFAIYMNKIPIVLIISSLTSLLIYFLISIYSLNRTNKLELTTERLEEEKLYNKTLTILYDNIRGFKHDFNNIVQAIGGYVSTNNAEGLKEYYSDLLNDCQKVNNLAVLNPELINNPAIYSLLTSKYHKAEELGIKINFEIFLDLQTLKIKIYDLTRILGILLDNAIEASSKCDEKEINIIIRKDNKANRQLFIIENTYSNKDVNTDRIFEKGYTSKADEDNKNHGIGLWEVRKILKKNNNLNLFTTKTDKLFKQQLEIY